MTLEDHLRDQLNRQADDVPLPDREPGRAVARARVRKRNRRAGAGAAVVLALVAGIGLPRVVGDGDGTTDDQVDAGFADGAGLPLTGPLTFDWSQTPDGLSGVANTFQTDDGTVYALSTGPGVRHEDFPLGDYPRALYRLGDDGTWQAVPLDGDRPDAREVATDGSLLYAISTGPAGDEDYVPQLSTSSDGGDTWTVEELAAAEPPSDVVPWLKTTGLAIESTADRTLAVVSNAFRPNQEEVFPVLKEPGGYQRYQAMPTQEGFALIDASSMIPPGMAEIELTDDPSAPATTADPTAPTTTAVDTTAPTSTAVDPSAPTTTAVDPSAPATTTTLPSSTDQSAPVVSAEPTIVEVKPWADLGVSGIEALGAQHQVFQRTGDAWEPVDTTGLEGVSNVNLSVSGGRFVATGARITDHQSGRVTNVVLTSTDGVSWSETTLPVGGQVVGVGSALLLVPYEPTTTVHVSPDGGLSWSEVDLAAFGLPANHSTYTIDAGPLGVAFVTVPVPPPPSADGSPLTTEPVDGEPLLVVSGDLVDWTVTKVSDVAGPVGTVDSITVGADRVVLTASRPRPGLTTPPESGELPDLSSPLESVTVVGTPIR